jgi:malonyl CoA-acyl carrier protein transacylase
MKAYLFPGQGSQFPGMAKDLYEQSAVARDLLNKANHILGFCITDTMFGGTEEDLKQKSLYNRQSAPQPVIIRFRSHYKYRWWKFLTRLALMALY